MLRLLLVNVGPKGVAPAGTVKLWLFSTRIPGINSIQKERINISYENKKLWLKRIKTEFLFFDTKENCYHTQLLDKS